MITIFIILAKFCTIIYLIGIPSTHCIYVFIQIIIFIIIALSFTILIAIWIIYKIFFFWTIINTIILRVNKILTLTMIFADCNIISSIICFKIICTRTFCNTSFIFCKINYCLIVSFNIELKRNRAFRLWTESLYSASVSASLSIPSAVQSALSEARSAWWYSVCCTTSSPSLPK